ncbi:MAG: CusA/CzcA family heavy metal efflux RND transporter [Cyclobacteriaceae bacterium]|nr:CusA/CzcA family heavy metal efflux RND transporter [Cyclobacteriaceae bacterium]
MLERIIGYSIQHKLIVFLFTAGIIGLGIYSLTQLPIGAVPDITNNQVQVITTSRNLATEDVEKYLTYPVELEMANLPGVKEIRSVSKFGLSVVTIVFEDKMGTYLPRQLIAEKLKTAEENIPKGFGTPFMGPVTTGLGEIYQYILDVKPAYKDNYSTADLRTIQDWVVRRQLSGIKGVVEVNTWGGHLKQYEVAINPEYLRAIQISLSEVYEALKKNNNVAGGGYIEKTNESFFIRGEGLINSLEDIRNIVVTIRDGSPIYIRDVAKVGFGTATRFGAITANGEGEKVLGQVMMLKDANSKATIDRVRLRVKEIQKTLPPGIFINGFLDRSTLIEKTTLTIAENLISGFLIVIFIVVLLLGNLRSGLVVASVIPISLLFAISLMYLFGVDANLMSLGAIDFGIIIDGAVIIVEFIAFKITADRSKILALPKIERQDFIDKITYEGTTKMMRSAVFGQIIIILVFIPILSLTGVEGKMFKPMALVFVFALTGTMILGFTYVPVVSSLFITPTNTTKRTISKRLMGWLEKLYEPSIIWALQSKKLIVSVAIALLIGTGILFSKMGGEFVPTLDEGDFVIQPVLKTGTSLQKTIETTTKIEQILKRFPEVKDVVTRIGAAEVPTDPMSMEESDVIITLIPKGEWVTASSKDELADHFKKALQEIPGIDYEFTQPIEMRFNELITGVRADLAIKIFGEDLDLLHTKAIEIENLIKEVPGASDIIVEKVSGLPQMSVVYNRQKIAKYGLNVADLNKVISMGFSGLPAGKVFEGEKQFDLVIRYENDFRKNIQNLEESTIQLPNGTYLPLKELATIAYTQGPAKISRDDTKRRIVVGVNVRNRDLESVVKDVQRIIESNVKLPIGYSITYGGQFENLNSARKRLMVAVPIALLLIFVLLYFAFGSVKDALMIYTAIPLSAVGGVLFLYIRDLPFSISAGVGFIALFGIAVLNGIVLIEHFKELKAKGVDDVNERIIRGTKERLRPVLLTAGAAALGFLPMAVSTSAGAEVQRPLATVVIGGLITATLLTMLVLPVLYAIFDSKIVKKSGSIINSKKTILLLLFLSFPFIPNAQNNPLTIEQAINIALEHNQGIKAASMEVEKIKQLEGTSFNFDKTQAFYQFDENNTANSNGIPLKVWGVSQSIEFPTVYSAHKKVNKQRTAVQQQKYLLDEQLLKKNVSKSYYNVVYWLNVAINYTYLDSLMNHFSVAASRKFELGETNYLEKLTASSKQKEVALLLKQTNENINRSYLELAKWLQVDSNFKVEANQLYKLKIIDIDTATHAGILYFKSEIILQENEYKLEKNKLLPDLHLSYFQGNNSGPNAQIYQGFEAGIGIPLFFGAQKSKINASKINRDIVEKKAYEHKNQLKVHYRQLLSDLNKYNESILLYNKSGKQLASELIHTSSRAYQDGEADFVQYILALENAVSIEMMYLKNLNNYNQTVLDINYLTN